jgi:ABC-2 type transport system permease protein
MTILSPIIMIALISLVAYLSALNNDKVRTIAVLDQSGLVKDVFKNTEHTSYNLLSNMSLTDAKRLVKETNASGLLYVEELKDVDAVSTHIKFYSEESPSLSLISDLETQVEHKLTDIKLQQNGVNVGMINASKVQVTIAQESFTGEKSSKMDSIMKLFFGGAAGYLLFMFIIIYGNMIMRSVIEEKTSRIIEVIISSVKPIQLMLGKIIGTSLAGITQFIIWIFIGGLLITILSVVFGVETQTPQQELVNQAMANPELGMQVQDVVTAFYNLPLTNLVIAFILFFVSGYLLYSSFYAAIGAAVDNETDTQQFMLPIIMPLMLAVYIGFFTVIEDPHGTVSLVFSFLPLTSPVVMLMRIPFGVPLWQQLLSLAILIGTFMFTVWFAAKIYRVGILMYGKKPSYKELMKWIKY